MLLEREADYLVLPHYLYQTIVWDGTEVNF